MDDAGKFWAELDNLLSQGEHNQDMARKSIDLYINVMAKYEDDYLKTEMDFRKCCYALLDSRTFQKFLNKTIEHLIHLTVMHIDLKELWVIYNILFLAGKENSLNFKLISSFKEMNFIFKLKQNICKLEEENTRDEEDETFNYSIIHLILSFNEQFMAHQATYQNFDDDLNHNTLLRVLSTRFGTSKTFGENVIFMLNREVEPHIQMLILKLLYNIFNAPETYDYFYTNDLCVLIDVFIRELYDLPEESEALRHSYLRVLYPLITNTQLFQNKYKKHHIYSLLLDLIGFSTKQFKPISPTTQRLVDRCLLAEYFEGISHTKTDNKNNKNCLPITPNSIAFPINTIDTTNGTTTSTTTGNNGVNLQGKFLRATTF
ncbi:1310_t:CDS:2 [Diversispora eburnea]|uniref:1310_t:CDS:1 n=1 Tax=Diversispora eburnea TaxID=1213867 RepID=A0A9N8V3G9_9GLOM|nr:1310_t:CDS:2 [Diversispora eburnea]